MLIHCYFSFNFLRNHLQPNAQYKYFCLQIGTKTVNLYNLLVGLVSKYRLPRSLSLKFNDLLHTNYNFCEVSSFVTDPSVIASANTCANSSSPTPHPSDWKPRGQQRANEHCRVTYCDRKYIDHATLINQVKPNKWHSMMTR